MKRIVLVISLLYWFSNGFAGDGSKTNPFTPTEVISLVALANGEKQSCDYWVESFIYHIIKGIVGKTFVKMITNLNSFNVIVDLER